MPGYTGYLPSTRDVYGQSKTKVVEDSVQRVMGVNREVISIGHLGMIPEVEHVLSKQSEAY